MGGSLPYYFRFISVIRLMNQTNRINLDVFMPFPHFAPVSPFETR